MLMKVMNTIKDERPGFFSLVRAKSNLLILIVAALILARLPYIGHLLDWQMTFFHEISHGLAALLTGGDIVRIELHFSGSGLCRYCGGLSWLVFLAGYAGASLWGLFIYLLAEAVPQRFSHFWAGLLAALLGVSGALYARDAQSWLILLVLALFYALAVWFRDRLPLKVLLKIAGLALILNALEAPLALFGLQGRGDAAELAALTGIPALFWIIIWLATACGCLIFLWKIERKPAAPLKTG